jgi:hypothetical protein
MPNEYTPDNQTPQGVAVPPTTTAPTSAPQQPAAAPAQPPKPMSTLQLALRGALAGIAAGMGGRTVGQSASLGAKAGNDVADDDYNRKVEFDKQQREKQEADDRHTQFQAQMAHMQAATGVAMQQLHQMTPGDPEYVKKIQEERAAQTDEAIKAGAQVITTAPDAATIQKKLQDEHFSKGDFSPQITVMHDAQGNTVFGAVVFPASTNTAPMTLTYPGADGKDVSKTFAPGTISLDSWNKITTTRIAKDIENQFDLFKQRTQFEHQDKQTRFIQGQENARSAQTSQNALVGKAIDQGQATVSMDDKGKVSVQAAAPRTDAFGTQLPPMSHKDEVSAQKTFNKTYVDPLVKLEKTTQQMNTILGRKDMTGADKVVGLFDAIGISAEPMKGNGFRVNNAVIDEHSTARPLLEDIAQKANKIGGSGGPVTENQLKDYTRLIKEARHDAYLAAANEAQRQGLKRDFLPRGNNRPIDPETARIFFDIAGNNPDAARNAAQAHGWKF